MATQFAKARLFFSFFLFWRLGKIEISELTAEKGVAQRFTNARGLGLGRGVRDFSDSLGFLLGRKTQGSYSSQSNLRTNQKKKEGKQIFTEAKTGDPRTSLSLSHLSGVREEREGGRWCLPRQFPRREAIRSYEQREQERRGEEEGDG